MSRDIFGLTKTERGQLINLARDADTSSMLEAVTRSALLLQLTDGWPTGKWTFSAEEGEASSPVQLEIAEAKTALDLIEKLFDGKLSSTSRAVGPMGGSIQKTDPIIGDGRASEIFIPMIGRLKTFMESPPPAESSKPETEGK